jgi:hypothetical protein
MFSHALVRDDACKYDAIYDEGRDGDDLRGVPSLLLLDLNVGV